MKHLKDLNELYDTFPNDVKAIADNNRFPYIHTKACIFLKTGPENYRKKDFFKMPAESWDDDAIKLITNGCQQILQGKGLTEQNPFTELGTDGFFNLFRTFHFEFKSRITKRIKIEGKTHFIDMITFEHLVDQTIVTYCNMVSY